MKYGKKRRSPLEPKHDGSSQIEKRAKHGRKEMRNVTRTARRGNRDEEIEANDQESDPSQYNEEDIEDQSDEETHGSKKSASDIPVGAAYDALLVLLKSEQKQVPKQKSKTKRQEIQQSHHEQSDDEESEEDEDEVAGANVEELDEEEDGEEEEETGANGADSDNEDDVKLDPFEAHFNNQDDDYLEKKQEFLKISPRWPIIEKHSYNDEKLSSILQMLPSTINKSQATRKAPTAFSSISDIKSLKSRVKDSYSKVYPSDLTTKEQLLLEPMLSYRDINFPYKSYDNSFYRKLYLLHVLNHINKTRDRVIKNNNKLRAYQEATKEGTNGGAEEPELRDQGFTRPKVLILLPTRETCYEVVEELIKISGSEQQENKSKFRKQFHDDSVPPEYKPEDFRDAFKGNNNDFFCIGIKFTRKTVKLYSSFYSSDIILASPIGLSMIVENTDKKKRQYDFLSSIEVLIVDKAQQIEMQNWDHVNTVMKYVNKIPKDFHDADFSRIRMWSINDQSNLIRQNLIFSEYSTPNINNFITSKSQNLQGKLKFKSVIQNDSCIMNSIGLKLKQIFHRFESPSPMSDPDSRFKFFINTVLPSLIKTTSYEDGLLIYIPSYYDYLRVKNHMLDHTKLTFGTIDEYSTQSKLSKTRTAFVSGKLKIILYTERLHYFRRFDINGVKNILMYGLPSNPLFYKELARFIGKSVFKGEADLDLSFMKVMYSKWDANALERVVGLERCSVLCNSVNEMYEFR